MWVTMCIDLAYALQRFEPHVTWLLGRLVSQRPVDDASVIYVMQNPTIFENEGRSGSCVLVERQLSKEREAQYSPPVHSSANERLIDLIHSQCTSDA